MKHMNRFFAALSLFAVTISAGCFAHAQTNRAVGTLHVRMAIAGMGQAGSTVPAYCTPLSPCAELTWNNGSDLAAAVTANGSGVETAGPAIAVVYQCTGATTGCPIPSATPPQQPSPWVASAVTNGQSLAETTASGGPFYVPVSYSTTYNFTLTLAYTGSQGGAASGYAAPFQLVFGNAPGATPSTPINVIVVPAT